MVEGVAIAVLKGSLAPDGAVIKLSAATPSLCQHEGPAVVFDSVSDLERRIDDPDLPVTPDSVMVLRNAGPVGAPGMPESGALPIPKKLGSRGLKDMVRISDARMSGTAFGTVVLHTTPEAAVGGPLALVRDGDRIRLDSNGRRLDLLVDEAELGRRANSGGRRRSRRAAIIGCMSTMSARRARAATSISWRERMQAAAERGRVIASRRWDTFGSGPIRFLDRGWGQSLDRQVSQASRSR